MNPTIHDLIANHALADAVLTKAARHADEVFAAEQGRVVTLDDEDARDHANEALRAALDAILAYVPNGLPELRAKVEYVLSRLALGDQIESTQVVVLLASVQHFRPSLAA